jgi:hypothetical protein
MPNAWSAAGQIWSQAGRLRHAEVMTFERPAWSSSTKTAAAPGCGYASGN